MRTIVALLLACVVTAGIAVAQQAATTGSLRADQVITSWKAKPAEVARKMIEKYGQPQEVTANRLIWHNNGPWAYSELVNEEIPHNFPVPHTDMLVQAVAYRIDSAKADELLEYDGSLILERTKGEIGARCDKEEANFLAINLAHDVATGKRSVADARRFYAESIDAMMKTGKPNEYLQGLRFTSPQRAAADPDRQFGPVATTGR